MTQPPARPSGPASLEPPAGSEPTGVPGISGVREANGATGTTASGPNDATGPTGATGPNTLASSATDPGVGERPSFLERSMRWWWVVGTAFLVAAGVLAAGDSAISTTDRTIALGLIAILSVGYLTYGRWVLRQPDDPLVPALLFLVPACAIVVTVIQLTDAGYTLLFFAYPHLWAMLCRRWAVIGSVVLTATLPLVTALLTGWSGATLAVVVTSVPSAAIGIVIGLWITGVIEESLSRKALIEELTRTRAALAETQHRAGAMAERERLAAEIHDTLAQGFMSILVQSQAADLEDPIDVRHRLDRIEETARENLAEARGLIEALQPTDLRERSLEDACRRVVERFAAGTGIDARFELEGEPYALPANAEVALLRATQEALTNVLRHAEARTVRVMLAYDSGNALVQARISDDGKGFDTARACDVDATGFGLRGMRARAAQVGGAMRVVSRPGDGTTVVMEVRR